MQGEVLEIELENLLYQALVHNKTTPVAKGLRGADLLHKVRLPSGLRCGAIIWETKRSTRLKAGLGRKTQGRPARLRRRNRGDRDRGAARGICHFPLS